MAAHAVVAARPANIQQVIREIAVAVGVDVAVVAAEEGATRLRYFPWKASKSGHTFNYEEAMNITLNGQSLAVLPSASVHDLLQQQGWLGKRVAVERNGDIIPKSQHADILLAEGDRLEIVVAVGGG